MRGSKFTQCCKSIGRNDCRLWNEPKIPNKDDCEFETDDEIVNEEEFLQIIDQELDWEASTTYHDSPTKAGIHEVESG